MTLVKKRNGQSVERWICEVVSSEGVRGWKGLGKFDRALLWISTAKADLRHRTADRTPLRQFNPFRQLDQTPSQNSVVFLIRTFSIFIT